MYLSSIIGLLTEGMTGRRRHRQRGGNCGSTIPAGLTGLGDYELRDIGYVRERTVAPRKHVLWM